MPNYRSLINGGFFSSDPMNKSVPVSIRCNNPGAVNGAAWERKYPGYVTEFETTPGNRTTVFETPEQGVAVWWTLLRRYRSMGATTLAAIINRYGGGQDYSRYVENVEKTSGIPRNTVIDLNDDDQLLRLARSMFNYEAGRTSPLLDAQILYGFHYGRQQMEATPQAPTPPAVPAVPVQDIIPEILAFLEQAKKFLPVFGGFLPAPLGPVLLAAIPIIEELLQLAEDAKKSGGFDLLQVIGQHLQTIGTQVQTVAKTGKQWDNPPVPNVGG